MEWIKSSKCNWHFWFAWYPVSIYYEDGTKKIVWLKTILRKGIKHYDWDRYWWIYQYKEIIKRF